MLTDRGRRMSGCNGSFEYSNIKFSGDNGYGFVDRREKSPPRSSASKILHISSPTSSPPSSSSSVSPKGPNSPGSGYIEHRVSKFDTLAGIAIKYGVEVADITKLNGLVTDHQMFALKSLQIPLPGRHSPSPCLPNGSLNHGEGCSEQASLSVTASNGNHQDVFDSFQSLRLKPSEKKISPAMNSLQGYYGLKPITRRASEGFEMALYKEQAFHLQKDDDKYLTPFPATNTPLSHHRKSRSLVDAVIAEVNQSPNPSKAGGGEVNYDKPMRRRQKSEADFSSRRAPELLLKEENKNSNGAFSATAGKGLALRSKTASRSNISAGTEAGLVPINLMDVPVGNSFSSVRKSVSASSLQNPNSDSNGLSLWPTSKWTLKPDLLTQAAIPRSIFDGLPKPLSGRKTKKAVD